METAFPFDAQDLGGVPDRRYAAADLAAIAKKLWQNGVLGSGDLAVTSGTGKTVSVSAGGAVIEGRFYVTDEAKTVLLGDNASGHDRIDLVVLRMDAESRAIYPAVIQGTPAASPQRPAPVQTTAIYDLPLAAVRVPNAFSAVAASYITDLR